MKNIEKFNDKIIELALSRENLAVNKKTLEPCSCDYIKCADCIVCDSKNCEIKTCEMYLREWANAEYVEPCPFEKDEIVEVSDDNLDWRIRYFDSLSDNEDYPYSVYAYGHSSKTSWDTALYKYCRKYGTLSDT